MSLTPEGASDPVIGRARAGFEAFQWHSYRSPLPPGAVELASSPLALQAYRIGDRTWGIQFHAEVSEVDAVSWAINYAVDPDAVRIGVDPDVLSAQILERIGEWNQLGRGLCGRFLQGLWKCAEPLIRPEADRLWSCAALSGTILRSMREARLDLAGREVCARDAAVGHEGRGGDEARFVRG